MNLRVFACLLSTENRSIKISLRIAPFKSACYKKNVKINQEFLLMKNKINFTYAKHVLFTYEVQTASFDSSTLDAISNRFFL